MAHSSRSSCFCCGFYANFREYSGSFEVVVAVCVILDAALQAKPAGTRLPANLVSDPQQLHDLTAVLRDFASDFISRNSLRPARCQSVWRVCTRKCVRTRPAPRRNIKELRGTFLSKRIPPHRHRSETGGADGFIARPHYGSAPCAPAGTLAVPRIRIFRIRIVRPTLRPPRSHGHLAGQFRQPDPGGRPRDSLSLRR
jgi:hypothetical protein